MPERLPRHTLVWIDARADWQALVPGTAPRVARWLQARLPAIVARGDAPVAAGTLRVGIPLPLEEDRMRLALLVQEDAVRRHAPPPLLEDVLPVVPVSWRVALGALHDDAAAQGLRPRVFGSVAWQALTGLAYIHAASDLDLLWDCGDAAQAERIVALLRRWEARYRLRADGELLLPGDVAINWREYADGASRLLGKTLDGCALLPRTALFAHRSAA